MPTLDETLATLVGVAKELLEETAAKGENFLPMAFPLGLAKDPPSISMVPLSGDEKTRHQEIEAIHLNLEANGCDALVVINDAWRTEVPPNMTPEEAMRQRRMGLITSKEGLVILASSKDVPARVVTALYKRVGNKIEWEKQDEVAEFESWMIPPQWRHNVAKGSA